MSCKQHHKGRIMEKKTKRNADIFIKQSKLEFNSNSQKSTAKQDVTNHKSPLCRSAKTLQFT